jgi:transposase
LIKIKPKEERRKTMVSDTKEQEARRMGIINGINNGIPCSKIAAKLGVRLRVIKSDIKRMRHDRDPALKKAYLKAEERVQSEKRKQANLPDERFQMMTGMTLKEKTFRNMLSFYKPELMEIIRSENESEAIGKLSNSVKRTLKHNGIIIQGWKTPEISELARKHLSQSRSVYSKPA